MPDMPAQSRLPMPEKAPPKGKIRVKLICPLYEIAVLEADSVLLPAVDGDILILPERAPIFFNLTAGRMIVYNKGQKPVSFFVSGGICEVRRNLCPVLAWGVEEEKIDVAKIEAQLQNAQNALKDYQNDLGKTEVASRIDFYQKILEALRDKPKTAAATK